MEGQGAPVVGAATSAAQTPQATTQTPQAVQPDATQGGSSQSAATGVDLGQYGLTEADLKGYQGMKAEYEQLRNRYSTELPVIGKIRDVIAEDGGIEKAMRVLKINALRPSEMSHEDVLVQKMMLDDPKLDEKAARLLVFDEYPDAGEDEDRKLLRETRMRRAADAAREEILKQQTNVAPEQLVRKSEKDARLQQAWTSVLPSLAGPLTIDLKDSNGADFWKLDYTPELTPEEVGHMNKALLQYVAQNEINPDQNGLNAVKQFRENMLFIMKRPQILKALIDDAIADTTKRMAGQNHNPGGVVQSYVAPTTRQPTRKDDGYA